MRVTTHFIMVFYQGFLMFFISLFSPFILIFLMKTGRLKKSPFYFGSVKKKGEVQPLTLWVHAVSLGEYLTLVPLLNLFKRDHPTYRLYLTTTCPEVLKKMEEGYPFELCGIFPLDVIFFYWRLKKNLNIIGCLLSENDFWPGHLYFCQQFSLPLFLVNGRMSAKSALFFKSLGFVSNDLFKGFQKIFPGDNQTREFFKKIGIFSNRLAPTMNTKWDQFHFQPPKTPINPLYPWLDRDRKIFIMGSTHREEDLEFLTLLSQKMEVFLEWKVVVVPRNPSRGSELTRHGTKIGLSPKLRSHSLDGDLIIWDSLGELLSLFPLADLVFMGGSLVPGIGGHNPIEAVSCGIPVLYGPHYKNFREVTEILIQFQLIEIVNNNLEIFYILANGLQKIKRENLTNNLLNLKRENPPSGEKIVNYLFPLGSLFQKNGSKRDSSQSQKKIPL